MPDTSKASICIRHDANHDSIRDTFHLCLTAYGHAQFIVLQKGAETGSHAGDLFGEPGISCDDCQALTVSFHCMQGSSLILRLLGHPDLVVPH